MREDRVLYENDPDSCNTMYKQDTLLLRNNCHEGSSEVHRQGALAARLLPSGVERMRAHLVGHTSDTGSMGIPTIQFTDLLNGASMVAHFDSDEESIRDLHSQIIVWQRAAAWRQAMKSRVEA